MPGRKQNRISRLFCKSAYFRERWSNAGHIGFETENIREKELLKWNLSYMNKKAATA